VKGVTWWTGASVAVMVVAMALAPGVGEAGGKRLELREARTAAREAVLADQSYRVIRSGEPLRTRSCWRARRRVVRCSLFRVAPNPCALDGNDAGVICTQALAQRRWLVEVKRRGERTRARILRIADGYAGAVVEP
jgi:hypothetical protein